MTHDTSVILEVEEDAVGSPPWLALTDNDGRHDLLPQLRLSLLDSGHDHVANTTGGETVETGTDTLDGDDVEVTSAGVVCAVHDGAAVRPCVSAGVLCERGVCSCREIVSRFRKSRLNRCRID